MSMNKVFKEEEMKKTWTLRRQLSILLTLIVIIQSLALLISLWATQVFPMLDAEALRLFNTTTENRVEYYNKTTGILISNLAQETKNLNDELASLAASANIAADQIYRDNAIYDAAALAASNSLVSILKQNQITGAFFILNGSNANKTADNAHSSVYIRNPRPAVHEVTNYTLEIGPTSVAEEYQIETGIRWDLDLKAEPDNNSFDCYEKPIWASNAFKGSEIVRYGYWLGPIDLLKDNQEVITYSLPILDAEGDAYGVIGFEIDLTYFSQYYLTESDLLYENSFYVIANMTADKLDLSNFIPSGVLAETYLEEDQQLSLKPLENGIYQTDLDELGSMFCSLRPLRIYGENSPFINQKWTLAYFVPSGVLTENSSLVKNRMVGTIFLTTLVALSAVVLLVYFFTRKITKVSEYVKTLSPYDEIEYKPTGLLEIDELMSAVDLFNQSLKNVSKTTSKILELSLLPIGGYEVLNESKYVILTDFLYWLLGIDPGTMITKEEWEDYNKQLLQNPVEDHLNIYYFTDEANDKQLWLRIFEAKSPTGLVGVILDVTDDFAENQRLANELDYDALTGLFNKTALEREANRKIKNQPDMIGAMIFIDLDNLKQMNDNYGHDVGDRLIIKAAEIFRYFESYYGIVSRISGDEFAIYLHGYDSQEKIRKILSGLEAYAEGIDVKTADGKRRPISFSSGLAWYPEDANTVVDLLKFSDFAMYDAKKTQRGCLCEYSKVIDEKE